jgi:hypothetical protein
MEAVRMLHFETVAWICLAVGLVIVVLAAYTAGR